jgi:CRP-like cAMP-binding protein
VAPIPGGPGQPYPIEPYGATRRDVSDAGAWWNSDVPGRQPTIELLSRVPLFEGLPKAHLSRVAALAEESEYHAGRVIVKRDDPGRAFYVIVEGAAKVVKGRIVTSRGEARLGPGDFFGELSLLDGDARSASVVATTPLTVIRIERTGFRRLLREEPDLAIKLLEGMARRTRAILSAPSL